MKLENIRVSGVTTGPSHVTVNGQTAVFQYDTDKKVFSRVRIVTLFLPVL